MSTAHDLETATLTFERHIRAPVATMYGLYADAKARMRWGTPSPTAVFVCDTHDFRVGGRDVFRCGPRDNPNISGVVVYQDIVPGERIAWSERIAVDGSALMASLATLTLQPQGDGTALGLLVQVTSFAGVRMIDGVRQGNDATLDNLVTAAEAARRDGATPGERLQA